MSKSSNLEFRKVKSLQFLYEVSEDGRFLRNAKSKKYLRIFKLDNCAAAYVDIKGEKKRVFLDDIVSECFDKAPVSKVILEHNGKRMEFDALSEAACYIAGKEKKNVNSIRSRMKKRRSHILGYDITYLNAET